MTAEFCRNTLNHSYQRISQCCPENQTGAKTVMFTGVEFQIKHMKGFRYGILDNFFIYFSFVERNGFILHLFFTVGFILPLLYFHSPVICYQVNSLKNSYLLAPMVS